MCKLYSSVDDSVMVAVAVGVEMKGDRENTGVTESDRRLSGERRGGAEKMVKEKQWRE